MRLIDADVLYETLKNAEEIARKRVFDTPISLPDGALNPSYISFMTLASDLTSFKNMVYDAPTVDAIKVIRCEYCIHNNYNWCDNHDCFTNKNAFCSDAERIET